MPILFHFKTSVMNNAIFRLCFCLHLAFSGFNGQNKLLPSQCEEIDCRHFVQLFRLFVTTSSTTILYSLACAHAYRSHWINRLLLSLIFFSHLLLDIKRSIIFICRIDYFVFDREFWSRGLNIFIVWSVVTACL